MPEASPYILVLSTCPDEATAERLAANLIDAKLAACVNILGPLRSIYRWQGAVQKDDEMLLIVKTHLGRYPEVERLIVQQHPYELPEVVQVAIGGGSAAYLSWIGHCLEID
ncbi:MAG: divalent-cation tolerance protein CutA [Gammaproteobacteria bacterium]|jgi:periplasmic divalent cation tolerance protein